MVLLKKLLLAGFILLLINWQITAFASTGIYANVESGWAKQAGLPIALAVGANNLQRKNLPVVRASVGYLHDFNERLGIGFEVARGSYGKTIYHLTNGTKIDVKTAITDFLLVTVIHFKRIDLLGKIGGNRNTTSIDRSNGVSDEQCRIQPVLMAGLSYNFTSHIAATISYMHSFGNSISNFSSSEWKSPGIDAVLGGLRITFW